MAAGLSPVYGTVPPTALSVGVSGLVEDRDGHLVHVCLRVFFTGLPGERDGHLVYQIKVTRI
jgi:hypothetical protein